MQSEEDEGGGTETNKEFLTVKPKLFCNIRLLGIKYIRASEAFEFKGCFGGLVALANLSHRACLLSKI